MSRVIHQLIVWCFKEKRKSQQFCKWVFLLWIRLNDFSLCSKLPFSLTEQQEIAPE